MPEELFTLLGMLLTVALVLLLAWLVTRYLAGRGPGLKMPSGQRRNMILLEQLPLGRDQRLVLVRVGERIFLLGMTPSGISHLAEFSGEEAARWLEENGNGDAERPSAGFRELLQETLNRMRK